MLRPTTVLAHISFVIDFCNLDDIDFHCLTNFVFSFLIYNYTAYITKIRYYEI